MESKALRFLINQNVVSLFENLIEVAPHFCSGVEEVFDCPLNDGPSVEEILY
jgi:hypothetical protein